MHTTNQVPVSEYLSTSYSPDCDYVNGELQERNVGEFDHAKTQALLVHWFQLRAREWNIHVVPEIRLQVAPARFRIADLCVLLRTEKRERILHSPPLLVIEILSPEDRISRYHERLADYRQMGVPHIWVVDPETRLGYDCSTTSWIESSSFRIPESGITLDLSAIFAELD